MRTSVYLFESDLIDEGFEAALDNVAGRGGLGGINIAAAYHHGRDIFPHSPVRKVRFLEGGTIFFHPDESRYGETLRPVVSSLSMDADVLALAVEAAGRRSMEVHAWTVYCHNTRLGTMHPELTMHNAFGDPYLSDLCPSHPEVQAFAKGLTADIASHGVQSILAESLHFGLFQHGHHHERYFIDLSPVAMFLMGLCFCEYCLTASASLGVDADRVRQYVSYEIQAIFDGKTTTGDPDLDESAIRSAVNGEMGRYLDSRADTVTKLTGEVTAIARDHGARVAFIDPSGAMKGYATGHPTGAPAPESAWVFGADLRAIGAVADIEAVAYAADPARVRLDLEFYNRLLSSDSELTAALRPMLPDCDSVENLELKLRAAASIGVSRIDFYHYGFMPLVVLDRIREALESTR